MRHFWFCCARWPLIWFKACQYCQKYGQFHLMSRALSWCTDIQSWTPMQRLRSGLDCLIHRHQRNWNQLLKRHTSNIWLRVHVLVQKRVYQVDNGMELCLQRTACIGRWWWAVADDLRSILNYIGQPCDICCCTSGGSEPCDQLSSFVAGRNTQMKNLIVFFGRCISTMDL